MPEIILIFVDSDKEHVTNPIAIKKLAKNNKETFIKVIIKEVSLSKDLKF